MNLLTSWRTSIRIARREARRSKGRSALVLLMIAAPVLFLTMAAVTIDMFTLTPAERADRTMGAADARITWWSTGWVQQDAYGQQTGGGAPAVDGPPSAAAPSQAGLAAKLPAGTQILPIRRGTVDLKTANGFGAPNAISVDATSPLTRGLVVVLAGRAPTAANEVALSEQAVERIGATVGGTITSRDGTRTYTVVGLVEFPSLLEEVVLFPPIPVPAQGQADKAGFTFEPTQWLVDTPAPIDWAAVLRLNDSGLLIASRAVFVDPPDLRSAESFRESVPRQLSVGVLLGGLALLEIVLLAGPAFAVSARRRQRQLALVAANGGTPAHVRRMVLADGVVLGVLGAAAGIAAGIPVAFAARPFLELYYSHARAGGYRVFPTALAAIAVLAVITGVLAALVPAFITARQNVVASLAGRRGITRSKKRWLALGLAMVAAGTVTVVYGTTQTWAEVMLAGLVVGELGIVFCTPAIVGLIARVGRILPLAPRIALRDAARNRASAAPAISAVMAAVAGSVAIGLFLDSSTKQQEESQTLVLPVGSAIVTVYGETEQRNRLNLIAAEAAARATLPVSSVATLRTASCAPGQKDRFCELTLVPNPERVCPWQKYMIEGRTLTTAEARAAHADPRCANSGSYGISTFYGGAVVDDGPALPALTGASGAQLEAATAMLRAGGIVVGDDMYVKDGSATMALITHQPTEGAAKVETDPLAAAAKTTVGVYVLDSPAEFGLIVSPGALARAGLVAQDSGIVLTTSRLVTVAESDRFQAALGNGEAMNGWVQGEAPLQRDPRLYVAVAAAALITLAAAAIGTGLAAADSRADLSTLASVGASPRMRRGLSLSQSAVIAGLGSVLGAAAGLGAAFAVLTALNGQYLDVWPGPEPLPLAVPWLSLAVALLVVPGIAILGAGLLTRSRLPIERRT